MSGRLEPLEQRALEHLRAGNGIENIATDLDVSVVEASELVNATLQKLAGNNRNASLTESDGIRSLSPRQRQVLVLVATGRTNQQIANSLQISPSRSKDLVSEVFAKLSVSSRAEAATLFARWIERSVPETSQETTTAEGSSVSTEASANTLAVEGGLSLRDEQSPSRHRARRLSRLVGSAVATLVLLLILGFAVGQRDSARYSTPPASGTLPEPSTLLGNYSASDITISVTNFTSDQARSIVTLTVAGREDLGRGVLPVPGRPAQLVDSDGTSYFEIGGTADPSQPRERRLFFPPVDQPIGQLTLVISGLEFVRQAGETGKGMNATTTGFMRTTVSDIWSIPFIVTTGMADSGDVLLPTVTPQSLGNKVSVTLETIRQGETETVISGQLLGIAAREMPELILHAQLVETGSDPREQIDLRYGFGPDRSQFEVHFRAAHGAVSLVLWAETTGHPRDPQAAGALAEKLGTQPRAVFQINLPG